MLKRIIALTLGVIILYLLPFSFAAHLRDVTLQTVKPVASYFVRRNSHLHNFVANIRQIDTLRQDKADLQQQNLALLQELAQQETIQRENATLRKELEVTGVTKAQEKALAHIVLVQNDGRDRTFTVDIGSAEGIEVGQAAIFQGTLVGKVISTRSHSAVVRSILSKESRVQAWISKNREKGSLVGTGTTVNLEDITQGVSVQKGDIVETSGLGGSLLQGILIGTVNQTISKQSTPTQSFSLNLAQDPLNLEYVFILLTDVE